MIQVRIIPTLLLKDDVLVKTVKFKKPRYIGDPINTVRIFNELEVDELVFLDITATKKEQEPNFKILREIANECFMPLAYGGGIKNLDTIKSIFEIGFEKVILNTISHENLSLVSDASKYFGNQSIVASIDVKKNFWGKYEVWSNCGRYNTKKNPIKWAKELENNGIGEILLTSIDKEGTWSGFDCELITQLTKELTVPLIAHGGAGNLDHINEVICSSRVSGVALGSMVIYQQKEMGVLINFPDKNKLKKLLKKNEISFHI